MENFLVGVKKTELFNEPYPGNGNWNSPQGWKCWRDGGSSCNGLGYQVAQVEQQYPMVITEFGENDCAGGYVTGLMKWMDSKGISYLAWTYNSWDCASGPSFDISSYEKGGIPTNYGLAVKNHYAMN